jgi:hypothetical protein
MNKYTFDFEIQTITTMFLNAMSEIVVKRFNVHKDPQDQIKIRVMYAPKQRVLADLLDKDQNIQLPAMACYIGGISRDATRVWNKLLGNFNPSISNYVSNEKTPIPVDVKFNVSVMTRYQTDMDQILTHLLPYINPYFVVSWRTPGRPDHEIRSNVFWDGNVSLTYPYDIAATTVARVVADLSFTFKGWLFQALPDDSIGTIITIDSTYYNGSIPTEYTLTDRITSTNEYADNILHIGSPPQPKYIEPWFAPKNQETTFVVYGPGFTHIENVYLSGLPVSGYSTLYSPFSAVPTLSADFPAISAVRLLEEDWSANSDNSVTFKIPMEIVSQPGFVDLILESPVGFGSLIQNTRINTLNPYLSTSPEYNTFQPFQFPFLSGVQIF